jgi:hypothetical protein
VIGIRLQSDITKFVLYHLLRKKNVVAAFFKIIISRNVTPCSFVNRYQHCGQPRFFCLENRDSSFLRTLAKTAGSLATLVPELVQQINCVTSQTTAVLVILIAPVVGCCKYGNEP